MWPKPVSICRKQSYCDQLWPWGGDVHIKWLRHQFQDVKHSRPGDEAMGNILHTDRIPPPLHTDEKPTDGGRPLLFSSAAAVPNGETSSTQRLMGVRRWVSQWPRCSLFHTPWPFPESYCSSTTITVSQHTSKWVRPCVWILCKYCFVLFLVCYYLYCLLCLFLCYLMFLCCAAVTAKLPHCGINKNILLSYLINRFSFLFTLTRIHNLAAN